MNQKLGPLRVTGITQRKGLFVIDRRIKGGCDLRNGAVITFVGSDVQKRVRVP